MTAQELIDRLIYITTAPEPQDVYNDELNEWRGVVQSLTADLKQARDLAAVHESNARAMLDKIEGLEAEADALTEECAAAQADAELESGR
jgi:hypothetical protein